MSEWIDISVPLRNGMPVWPGDTPFQRTTRDNVSEVSTSLHIGTHIDAPCHYFEGASGIDAMPITAGVGPARVIEIHDPDAVRIAELEPHALQPGERVLFKTRNSATCSKSDHFHTKYVSIPPETAHFLVKSGLKTVGIDYFSVGEYGPGGDETHRILLTAGIWIIEGLMLENVAPGDYELLCLPLKIVGSDGAPARAVLRKLTG